MCTLHCTFHMEIICKTVVSELTYQWNSFLFERCTRKCFQTGNIQLHLWPRSLHPLQTCYLVDEFYRLQPSSFITARANQDACSAVRGAMDYGLYSQPWLWLIAFSKHQLGAGCDYIFIFSDFWYWSMCLVVSFLIIWWKEEGFH